MTRASKLKDVLPTNLPPRGLSRAEAASYIGLSPSKFDELVRDGRMPPPAPVDGRRIWDREALDGAFEALFHHHDRGDDPWDNVAP